MGRGGVRKPRRDSLRQGAVVQQEVDASDLPVILPAKTTVEEFANTVRSNLGARVQGVLFEETRRHYGMLTARMNGRMVIDSVDRIGDWRMREKYLNHEEAAEALREMVPGLKYPIGLDKVKEALPPEMFFSSRLLRGRTETSNVNEQLLRASANEDLDIDEVPFVAGESERYLAEYRAEVKRRWEKKWTFPRVPKFGDASGFSVESALKLPRNLTEAELVDFFEKLGIHNLDELSPDTVVEFQLYFIEASRKALAEQRKNATEYPRVSYFLNQAAIFLSKKFGKLFEVKDGKLSPAPSLGLFDETTPKETIRRYVDAKMSLLLPDRADALISPTSYKLKGFVYDDAVTSDLIAVTKAHGIYDEYKELFDDYLVCQQVQNRSHMARLLKEAVHVVTRGRVTSDEVDEKPTLLSMGCGSGFVENFMCEQGWVKEGYGVDVVEGPDERSVSGTMVVEKLDVRGELDRGLNRVFGKLKKSDIVIAIDVLHEVANPYQAFQKLLSQVNPGGALVIVDPTFLDGGDPLAPETTLILDSTHFPKNMFPLPNFFELEAYATLKGFDNHMTEILAGAFFGYGDPYPRILQILHKGPVAYEIPQEVSEMTGVVEKPEDVFNVWPFSRVREADKSKLLTELGDEMVGTNYSNLWKSVIKFLLPESRELRRLKLVELPSGGSLIEYLANLGMGVEKIVKPPDEDKLEESFQLNVKQNLPYPYLKDMLANLKLEDEELDNRNIMGGVVKTLRTLLKDIGVSIDFSRDQGWAFDTEE